MIFKRKMIFALAFATALAAYAATKIIGAWHVATAGPDFVQTTFREDKDHEWNAANHIFLTSVYPQMQNPFTVNSIIKWDYFRIVYYDGQIADFKILKAIAPTDGGLAFQFTKLAPTVNSPAPGGRPKTSVYSPSKSCAKTVSTDYDTGYWGWTWDVGTAPPPGMDLPTVSGTQTWNSTGIITIVEKLPPDNCK